MRFFKYLLLLIHVGVCSYAQQLPYEWGFYHAEFPKKSSFPGDYFHATGAVLPYTGIGMFSLNPISIQMPKTLMHLYSNSADPTHNMLFPPAVLRLQSSFAQQPDRTLHIPSAIEFRNGIIDDPLGKEEQIAKIQTFEMQGNNYDLKMFSVMAKKPRGIEFRIQKTDLLGTERDGDIPVMTMLTAHHKIFAAGYQKESWLPRIGIGNEVPKEMLHIGRRFTFHAGGSSRIADNLYYDIVNDCNRRIDPGPGSAISMYKGSISLGITSNPDSYSEPVSFEWGNDLTYRGMVIQYDGTIGIGLKYPEAALDIISMKNTQEYSSLRIRNDNWVSILDLKGNGYLGLQNAEPKEHLHIGDRLTLHAGNTSFIADNIYSTQDTLKNIVAGQGAFLRFNQGHILLANSSVNTIPQNINIQKHNDDIYSVRGLSIEPLNAYIGIGTMQPKASLDILSNSDDSLHTALTISSKSYNTLFSVLDNGYIGIGTAHPEQSLHVLGNVQIGNHRNTSLLCPDSMSQLYVDGAIITKELLITSESWADTVFSDTYHLMQPLELEHFINKYKHLPDIPMQAEIMQTGINIGTMQIALLKKIEEMTLHIISLHKKQTELETLLYSYTH